MCWSPFKVPKRDKFAGLSRRAKRRKLAMEEDNAGESGAARAAVRSAKKAARPTKIGIPEPRQGKSAKSKSQEKKKRRPGPVTSKQGVFDREMGEKRKAHVSEGVRSNKADRIVGAGKKGLKNRGKGKGKR